MAERGRRTWSLLLFAMTLPMSCVQPRTPPAIPPVEIPARIPAPTAPAAAPALPAEGTIDGGAGPLWFHVVGSGADTVLVPLASWIEPALSALGEQHTIVFYDPRHRGRSHALTDSAAATFDGDVADLEAVRAAAGASRVAVIGYDYYAAVAAAWAAANPHRVTRLVLLSPIEPADSLAAMWNPAERMVRLDTTAARALVKARAAGRDTADAARYCEDFWRVNAPLFVGDTARAGSVRPDWCQLPNESPARIAVAAEKALGSLGPAVDFGARARGVTAPTLVMHGRQDLISNPEGAGEWARRIEGARLLWLSNVGHLPFLEDQATVTESIAEFLAGRWPPRAGPP
jgi:pimeloyl-ACP methyl ester carboxylesterase